MSGRRSEVEATIITDLGYTSHPIVALTGLSLLSMISYLRAVHTSGRTKGGEGDLMRTEFAKGRSTVLLVCL